MIELVIAICLATLGLTVANTRCIHRVEKKLLYFMYMEKKEKHELEDK